MSYRRLNITRSSSSNDLESFESERSSSRNLTRSSSSANITLDNDLTEKKNNFYEYTIYSVIEAKEVKSTNKVNSSLILSDEPISSYMPYLNKIKTNFETLLKMRKGSYEGVVNETMNRNYQEEESKLNQIVPELFFNEEFDITSSTTFYKIYEEDNDSKNITTIGNLQRYLDAVEKELSQKLNKRTDSFFNAFEDLQSLHTTLQQAYSTSKSFKQLLNDAEMNIVNENLGVIKYQIRQRNLMEVQNKLKLISNVKKSLPVIKDLISQDQPFKAIKCIDQSRDIITSQLAGIQLASNFLHKLENLRNEIDHQLMSQFVILACGNLELNEDYKEKIMPLINQLVQSGKLPKSLDYYLDIQDRDISELFISCWKGEANEIERNNSASIVSILNGEHKEKEKDNLDETYIINLDNMIFCERFEYLLSNLFKKIRSAKNLYNFIEDVFSHIDSEQDTSDSNDELEENLSKRQGEQQQLRMKLLIDLNDLLNSITDIINVRIAKIFNLRTEQHKRITPQKFIFLHKVMFQFIKDCESLTHRESYLRSTLSSFKKTFIEASHSNKIAKLSLILENENWIRAEIASEFSGILNCLMDPDVPLNFTINESTENVKDVFYGGERYLLVNSGLLFTKMIHDYLLILEEIPGIHKDIISKISDLFNTFHTKTYSLILGRKAVKMSTLKSISATHMALTWQALTLMITIIPNLKIRILNLNGDEKYGHIDFSELDKVLHEFILHREEVISKIVTLMNDRLDSLFKGYKVDETSSEPSKPFVQLAEKTKVLHKVLRAVIHKQHFNITFKQIVLLYNNKLTNIFSNMTIKSPKEKQKMLQDAYYFLGKLRELEGIEDPTDEVAEYIHAHVK